jgi:peptidoglycan hydrolase-like protein with peptidoglycan-binding domain
VSFSRRHQAAHGIGARARSVGRLGAIGAAAVLTLAACGGSDGNSSTSTTVKGGTTTVKGSVIATTIPPATTVATTLPATAAPTAAPTPTTAGFTAEPTTGALKKGMKGNRVAAMQTKLKALGYDPGPADSLFGEKTEAAVKKFQSDKKLQIDGVAGNQTLGALDTACKAKGC